MTERLHFHFSFSCIGEWNGNPLQYSCLGNPRAGEPGGLPSMGSHRVRPDWSDLAAYIFLFIFTYNISHLIKCKLIGMREFYMLLYPSCFFNDPTDVGNLISVSSAFSKSSLNKWKFMHSNRLWCFLCSWRNIWWRTQWNESDKLLFRFSGKSLRYGILPSILHWYRPSWLSSI